MAILGLQGLRGGVGTTSLTAALGWSLQMLGESVIVVDACPDNMLRFSFNDDIAHQDVGLAHFWMVKTGVKPGCVIPLSSTFCPLANFPSMNA
jgi:cell division protein YhjQ